MRSHWLCYVFLFFSNWNCEGYQRHGNFEERKFGSVFEPTRGEPWPKPQLSTTYGDSVLRLRPNLFRFEIVKHTCDIIEEATSRYYKIISEANNDLRKYRRSKGVSEENVEGRYLDVIKIHLMAPCEKMPHEEMDESYEVKINSPDYRGKGLIAASSNWGILRGLETFSQLLHPNSEFTSLQVKSVLIVDYPRFPFRSLLLDTSRHFLPKKFIYDNLDLMAMNKYNVLHWHIVDDPSFPYQSAAFPELSEKGAFHPYTHVYTRKDVRDVIEYARYRGIRVIPEFDTPGHTLSWFAIPNLLTKCYNETTGHPNGQYGPINPTIPANFDFLRDFFSEVATVFPDGYVHLGGDEVDFACWKSNPEVKEFVKANNFTKEEELQEYYIKTLAEKLASLPQKRNYMVWEEVFNNAPTMDSNMIVHVWIDPHSLSELANVTAKGYRAVYSACWYLNYISYGPDWIEHYKCDPHNFTGTAAQKRLVLGGGATMWGEYVDETNVIQRTWPRAAAPAERLWSAAYVNDTREASHRLEEHRCRLRQRGYPVEPVNGPGFCLLSSED